jgi:hypothetical protein
MKQNKSKSTTKKFRTYFIALLSFALLVSVNQVTAQGQSVKSTTNTRDFTRWDYYSYKFVGEKLNRLILPAENFKNCKPCKWTNADGRKLSNFHPIRAKAFEEIKKFGRQLSMPLSNVDWNFTQSVQPDLKKVMTKLNEQGMRYWSSSIKSDTPYVVIVGEDKSRPELVKMLGKTNKGRDQLPSFNSFFDRYQSLSKWEKARPLGGGQATIDSDAISGKKIFLLTYHVASYTTEKTYFFTTPAHEVTHIFQSSRANDVGYSTGMPISLWEGTAVLFGAGISMPNLGWYSDELDHVMMRFLTGHDRSVEMRTNKDAVELLKAAEDPLTDIGTSAGYNVGPLLFEWFVAQYGVQKFVSLVEAAGTASSFDDALKQTIGLSKEQLYESAAPYVLKSYQRVQKIFRG